LFYFPQINALGICWIYGASLRWFPDMLYGVASSIGWKSLLEAMMSAWGQALGAEYVGLEGRLITFRVPYAEHLVGDPDSGVIHGGVITSALDNASGWAVRALNQWQEDMSMATLDLRIDYMKPAKPHADLLLTAECTKMTKTIAFVSGLAHQGDESDPIATSVAAFMLGTPNSPR